MTNFELNNKDIIEFFNNAASTWDKHMVLNENIINTILNNAEVFENKKVLDVACGTGVLIPYYLNRKVETITAIDISSNMIEVAKNKFRNNNIKFVCDDIATFKCNNKFDNIIIYNSFPHFIDQEAIIQKLSTMLNNNGCLSIAHSMSRETLNNHHINVMNISHKLISIDELSRMVSKYLIVEKQISNNEMYQIVGKAK